MHCCRRDVYIRLARGRLLLGARLFHRCPPPTSPAEKEFWIPGFEAAELRDQTVVLKALGGDKDVVGVVRALQELERECAGEEVRLRLGDDERPARV